MREISIVQYQNVSPRPEVHRLWLSAGAFREQMNHLAASDFTILSMDDALDVMEKRKKRPRLPLALSFDNGFRDLAEHAFPLLFEHGFTATLLVSPLRVGTTRALGSEQASYLSWDDLRELAGQGITVGAYEDEALSLKDIPEETVCAHIVDFKRMLEDRLGSEVRYFGVKEGVPRRRMRSLLEDRGYRAFLTQCPTNRGPDRFSLGRIQVDDPDFNIFLTKISRTYLFFKDRRVWRYIRRYRLDRAGHRVSETYDRLRGKTQP